MSVPPDYMQLNPDLGLGPQMSPLSMSWQQNLQGMLGNPQTMGLAAALLQASGPSRMPTSLGSALGSGIMYGPQYEQQGLQNQLTQLQLAQQRMMLPLTQARINFVTGQGQQPNYDNSQPTQQTSAPAQTGQGGSPVSSGQDTSSPSGQYSPQSSIVPGQTAGGTLYNSLMGDPTFKAGMLLGPQFGGDKMMQAAIDQQLQYNPLLQGQIAGAKAEAEFPTKARESLLSQMGRVTSVNPGEGQVAQSGLSLAPPQLLNALLGGGGLNMGGGNTVQPVNPSPSGNMSGIPTVPVQIGPNGGMNSQNAVYPTTLQKELATSDAKYIDTLQTAADSASQGKQNIDEMWQAYQAGLPTGSLASFKVDLQKGMNALGVPMNDTTLKQISNYEAFSKNQAQLGISLAKSVSQRPSQFEFKYLNSTAVANPKLQGASIPILLSQMDGTQTYAQQKAIYVNNQAHQGINPRTAALQYDTNASIMPYALQTLAQKDPQSYMRLKQEMQSTASGRAFMAEIEKKAAWMQKNGGL